MEELLAFNLVDKLEESFTAVGGVVAVEDGDHVVKYYPIQWLLRLVA